MGYLNLLVIVLDLAAYDPKPAFRQEPTQIVGPGVKEHQIETAGLVGAAHLIGQARMPRRQVGIDPKLDRRDGAGRGLRHLGGEAAVDHVRRQVPQEVDHIGAGNLLDELGDTRADPVKRGHGRKQSKQDLRAHDGSL